MKEGRRTPFLELVANKKKAANDNKELVICPNNCSEGLVAVPCGRCKGKGWTGTRDNFKVCKARGCQKGWVIKKCPKCKGEGVIRK